MEVKEMILIEDRSGQGLRGLLLKGVLAYSCPLQMNREAKEMKVEYAKQEEVPLRLTKVAVQSFEDSRWWVKQKPSDSRFKRNKKSVAEFQRELRAGAEYIKNQSRKSK